MEFSFFHAKTANALCVGIFFSFPVLCHAENLSQSSSLEGANLEECSYQQAQHKMIQFNNIMQEINLEIVKQQAANNTTPRALYEKVTQMVEESTPLNEKMGNIPNPESIQPSTLIDPSICKDYNRLIQNYSKNRPSQPKSVKLHKDPTCDQTSLWTRYSTAMQSVTKAFQENKITSAEVDSFRVLDVQIGTYSTTDLSKACEILKEYESRVNTTINP